MSTVTFYKNFEANENEMEAPVASKNFIKGCNCSLNNLYKLIIYFKNFFLKFLIKKVYKKLAYNIYYNVLI